jgi:hypothetical protein
MAWKPKPGTTRDHVRLSNGMIVCFPSNIPTQFVTSLGSPREESAWHDSRLAEATIKLNEILADIREHGPDGTELAFVRASSGRLVLAWTTLAEHRPEGEEEIEGEIEDSSA